MISKNFKYVIFATACGLTAVIGAYSLAQNIDKFIDTDKDGLTDYLEKEIYYTDPYNPDTDGDSYPDKEEIDHGYSPKQPKLKMNEVDSDNDGLNDEWEIRLGTDIMNQDSDNDGFPDGVEVLNNYSPTNSQPVKVKKLIEISAKTLRLSFYFDNILLDNYPVSTGKTSTPTPLGEFSILAKVPIKNYYNLPNTKWNLHFATKNGLRYYIHGAYWHNKFGLETVSGGCVNLRYEDMEPLYKFTPVGTQVIIN